MSIFSTPEFSGKWIILYSLLRSWKDDTAGKHKVLVFSSSVKLLKMLYDFIKLEYNCEMLHGGKKDEERIEAVDRFQTDNNVFVFLINPAHDLQAMDRAFRMGQKRDVDVYRLVSLGTIEENIYERQMRKSAAMRIIYDDAMDSRVFVGNESGAGGDLWGASNLFTYNPEGTSLQRMFKDLTEDATLLEAIGDLFPGLRREGVAKAQNKSSSTERFLVEQAAEDYRNNPALANRPANEHYQDAAVAQALAKRKGRDVKRKINGTKPDADSRMAPRLNLPRAERHSGLVSDDE
ncbi:hypothetical protein QFC19_000689 [Naganishia cerealis]|uniref:Uncharacterized protein n=1 Tax=Naganishia cerealis TaxID=610337 RepID=A0ACC2WKK0_9TREE|nr:hypothetical protein QFC19_000689 [Naganishia cerealis]